MKPVLPWTNWHKQELSFCGVLSMLFKDLLYWLLAAWLDELACGLSPSESEESWMNGVLDPGPARSWEPVVGIFSVFSNIRQVTSPRPCLEYWYHGNQQTLQIKALSLLPPSIKLEVTHLSAYHWLIWGGESLGQVENEITNYLKVPSYDKGVKQSGFLFCSPRQHQHDSWTHSSFLEPG